MLSPQWRDREDTLAKEIDPYLFTGYSPDLTSHEASKFLKSSLNISSPEIKALQRWKLSLIDYKQLNKHIVNHHNERIKMATKTFYVDRDVSDKTSGKYNHRPKSLKLTEIWESKFCNCYIDKDKKNIGSQHTIYEELEAKKAQMLNNLITEQ